MIEMKLSRIFIALLVFSIHGTTFADKLSHLRTSKKIITVDVISAPYFTIQVVALKKPPKNASFFNNLDVIKEYSCSDGFVRYTVGEYNTFDDAARNLDRIRALGYRDAFVLDLQKIKLSKGSGSFAYSSGGGSSRNNNFVPVPGQKYTIQLSAMRFPVYLTHFKGFDNVKEYYMKSDRIYRYCVGTYNSSEILSEIQKVKAAGYKDAYAVPVEKYAPYLIE